MPLPLWTNPHLRRDRRADWASQCLSRGRSCQRYRQPHALSAFPCHRVIGADFAPKFHGSAARSGSTRCSLSRSPQRAGAQLVRTFTSTARRRRWPISASCWPRQRLVSLSVAPGIARELNTPLATIRTLAKQHARVAARLSSSRARGSKCVPTSTSRRRSFTTRRCALVKI